MLFDTPVYFLFFVSVAFIYWRLPWRQQNVFLLIASYFFYGWWDWRFLSLILISTVVDYHCARFIAQSRSVGRRRLLLTISLCLNVGFLGVFKYFNFFADSLAVALHGLGLGDVHVTTLQVVLPPGISFYTFQEIAYIVDVYFDKLDASDSFVDYALFISLFPHLIAGPIQRPSHLLPQVQRPRKFDPENAFSGILLILTGLFRKCVVADNCALLANAAFAGKLGPPSLAVLFIGTWAFAWQIYGDFSGYSNIARGSAQILGFHFMVNFRQPYLATSLQDFWRRWHISLSTWLRDYLYIPLGGNRNGTLATYRNLMTTMLLGGLWHGANWTFVVWGGIHGVGLAVERKVRQLLGLGEGEIGGPLFGLRAWVMRIVVFHLVCLSWIFFRASSVSEAFRLLSGLGNWSWRPEFGIALKFLALFTIPLLVVELMIERSGDEYLWEAAPVRRRLAMACVVLTALALFSANEINAFIYFQF